MSEKRIQSKYGSKMFCYSRHNQIIVVDSYISSLVILCNQNPVRLSCLYSCDNDDDDDDINGVGISFD